MKLFRFLFYRLYQLMISVGNNFAAGFHAVLLMGMTLGFNFYTIIPLFYLFTGKHINYPEVTPAATGIIFLGFVSVLYLLFARDKKLVEIKKEYENESKNEKSKGRIIIISYILLSYILLFSSVYLMMMKNRGGL